MAAACLLTLAIGPEAVAQTYTVGPGSAPFNVVASAASGDSQFTIDAASGSVTRDSGLGGRVSTNAANATVTVSCGNQNQCNTKVVNVQVGAVGTPTGRVKAISAFNVASGTGTVSNVSGSNPITFQLSPIGRSSSKTFKLGMTFRVKGDDSGVATGEGSAGYYVSVAAEPTAPAASGANGSLTATVYRSLSVAKNSDLNFGRIVRPLSGSGVATLNSNGTRTTTNGVTWLATPFPIRASFLVTGEGGKQLSVNVDPTFTMSNGGAGSVVVTTLRSGLATPTLSAGTSGTYSFFVGGQIPLSDTTPSGSYSGTFNVTVAYN